MQNKLFAIVAASVLSTSLTAIAQPPVPRAGHWQCMAVNPRTQQVWYRQDRDRAVAIGKARQACFNSGYRRCRVPADACAYEAPRKIRWRCSAFNGRGIEFTAIAHAPRFNAEERAMRRCRNSPRPPDHEAVGCAHKAAFA